MRPGNLHTPGLDHRMNGKIQKLLVDWAIRNPERGAKKKGHRAYRD